MMQTMPDWLRTSTIYCVYVRNYGPEGTLREVEADLDRIQALGVDILWLLPIYPVGKVNRKGSMGSPYSISDYRAVNPEYGTIEDFKSLCDALHARGMRCMLDIVYNHTAWDSKLFENHPEWFYHTTDGHLGNRAGAWTDIIDLDYDHAELWEYQIETLCHWARLGADGFRCDVASTVPVEFWRAARSAVEQVKPGVVWLAESVHGSFVRDLRSKGFYCASDGELYNAFDITYDYDVFPHFEAVFEGTGSIARYLEALIAQESTYPADYLKLHFLENHDQRRAASYLTDTQVRRMWTAFMWCIKGVGLIYNGQEVLAKHTPSLFEREPIDWSGSPEALEYCELLHLLVGLKKLPVMRKGRYSLRAVGPDCATALVHYELGSEKLHGIFNLSMEQCEVQVTVPDGMYPNLLGGEVRVEKGVISCGIEPIIILTTD